MRSSFALLSLLTALTTFLATVEAHGRHFRRGPAGTHIAYPKVREVNKTWSFASAKSKSNVTVTDPYFWLEAPSQGKEIQRFVTDQTTITENYIKGCKNKKAIDQSLLEASTFRKYEYTSLVTPKKGGNSFYLYVLSSEGDKPPVWYTATVAEFQAAKKNNFQTPPGKPFLDEALLNAKGTASILTFSTSPDAKTFGYLVVENGEVGTWFFRSFTSPLVSAKTRPLGGEGRLKDILPVSADQAFWTPDSKGLFYPKTVSTNEGTNTDLGYKIQYHAWGTDNTKDVTIFDSKNAGKMAGSSYFFNYLSPDGKWLVVCGYYDASSTNMIGYATKLTDQKISENMKWISLSPSYDFSMFPAGIVDDSYIFPTYKDAPNGKVSKIVFDWSKARQVKSFTELQDRPKVIDVVPERPDALIVAGGASVTNNDKLVVHAVGKGQTVVHLYSLKDGKEIQRLVPKEKVTFIESSGNQDSDTFLITFSSWNSPRKIFEFKTGSQIKTSLLTTQQIKGTNPNDFVIEELHATAKDGTKIPYFITYRKGTKKNGKNPAWIHVYGAYGIVESLFYWPNYFDFLRSYDGFFVWASPRGGGDLGGKWHEAAQGLKKQTTFDDTIAIMQDMIKQGITSAGKIILEGGSAGGLAVGAVVNQAPELVGVGLMVRAPLDAFLFLLRTTVGSANRDEFGDIATPEGFDAVYAWSPLHNIQPKKSYPAVLVTPGSGDERVPPSSSYKYIAQLQHDHPNNSKPLLMFVVKDKGHVASTVDESSHQFCLIEQTLGITRRKS